MASPLQPNKRRQFAEICAVVLLALLIRGGVVLLQFERLKEDPDAYRSIATCLQETGVYGQMRTVEDEIVAAPTAFRPPVYAIWLAWFADAGSPPLVAFWHLIWGVATVFLVYRLGLIWNLRWGALLAAGLTAVDPILLNQSTLVMTETLAAFFTILLLWLLSQIRIGETASKMSFCFSLAIGVIFGVATLCRPVYLPMLALVAFAFVFIAYSKQRESSADSKTTGALQRLLLVATMLVGAALVLAPWTIRNNFIFGKPIFATTHGGYTLYLANNDSLYDYLEGGNLEDNQSVWTADLLPPYLSENIDDLSPIERELQQDKDASSAAKVVISNRRGVFAYSCLTRIGSLWSPRPNQLSAGESTPRRIARHAITVWYLGCFLAIGVAVVVRRHQVFTPPWLWGWLACVAVTTVHTFYWSNMRMRAPLVPFLSLVVAAGVMALIEKRRNNSNVSHPGGGAINGKP